VPVLVYDVKLGKPIVICGQGPGAEGGDDREIQIARARHGAGQRPSRRRACRGPFETWMMLLRDHGTLTLRDVLEPAIFYAREGQPLVERATATIATGRAAVPRSLEDVGRHLPSGRKSAGAGNAAEESGARGDV
jgi:gamma-glutamyltranspeptidase/glutathione hydrolase